MSNDVDGAGPAEAIFGLSLVRWKPRPGSILEVRLAHWREPYFWIRDKSGLRVVEIIAIHYTSREGGRFRLLAAVAGPLMIRFGWMQSC